MAEKFLPPRSRGTTVPPSPRPRVPRPVASPKDVNLSVGQFVRLSRRAARITGVRRLFR